MKSIISIILVSIFCVLSFSSCDPALRLRIINLSDIEITFDRQDLHPSFLDDSGIDSLNRVIVLEPKSSYEEFYGIGGWWDGSEILMQNHLDSIIEVSYYNEFKTTSNLSEFGESLMTYEIGIK